MNLYEQISDIFPHLVSIRKLEDYITIDVEFPTTWKLPKKYVDEKMVVEEMKKRPAKQKIEKMADQEVVNKYMNIPEFCQEGVGINFDIDKFQSVLILF